jgi:allophanate hydrolase
MKDPMTSAPTKTDPKNVWIDLFASPLKSTQGGQTAGQLAGLTFAVKDNIDVNQKVTTAGSKAFAFTAKSDATVVAKLLGSGASLLGKTNLDQFACGLNGTRSDFGACENAFDASYISGGSSAGSAIAVATGQVDFALGTDTAGSGRVPAALNNIVGLKPSRGLISCAGVLPASQSVDCVSIFAQTVDVAVQVLAAATGYDEKDRFSRPLVLAKDRAKVAFTFGVPKELEFFGDQTSAAAFDVAVASMQAMGGKLVFFDYAPLAKVASLLYESAFVAERYQAIRHFFDANEATVFEPVRKIIAGGKNASAADLFESLSLIAQAKTKVATLMASIDFMLLPSTPTTYTIKAMQENPIALNRNLGYYTNFVNLLDMAAIAIPAGFKAPNFPFGITLVGACASDLLLAQYAQRFMQSTPSGYLGISEKSLPPAKDLLAMWPDQEQMHTVKVAVVGAHLSGMPLNSQLVERQAKLLIKTKTAAKYALYALPNTTPPKPGLKFIGEGGASIDIEVWEMPIHHYGSFVALIPSPLGIGTLFLVDGSSVQGFICESWALEHAKDVSQFGGWRGYLAQLQK